MKKKWEDVTGRKKNGETRCETKKNGEARCKMKKKWGDETSDEKQNWETR